MPVSGKKAAIVLASKPETWIVKSVNSLPMAAFYMSLRVELNLMGEKPMTKQSLSLNTVLGTGVFCAALAAAPLTGLISGSAYALVPESTKNCTSAVLTKLGTTKEKLDSLVVDSTAVRDALVSAKAQTSYAEYGKVWTHHFNTIHTTFMNAMTDVDDALRKLMPEEGYTNDIPTDKLIEKAYQAVADNAANAADIQKALDDGIAKQKEIAKAQLEVMKAAGFTDIDSTDIDNYTRLDFLSTPFNTMYESWKSAHPTNWDAYWDIWSADTHFNQTNVVPDGMDDYTDADIFLQTVCSATQANPNFKVTYTGSNPFGDKAEEKPTTPTQPTTIETKDKGVRISGLNINVSYTLNVNIIAADQLKLTGSDFKNGKNQAFYDIYVRDSQDNLISNVGKAQVSIKLPHLHVTFDTKLIRRLPRFIGVNALLVSICW